MATVDAGRVVIFGAGGPLGAMAIQALKGEYQLRVTDVRPMEEISRSPSPQGPRAPVPELLGEPHENRVVDITRYDQVLEACRGMDAVINVSVLRHELNRAFSVNYVGAYNVAKGAVECGVKRLIHTGPFHTWMGHNADYWNDFQVGDDIPLHPGEDLYAVTKYLGGHVTRVFAEGCGLEVLTFLYCGFRPRKIEEEERGKGMNPFLISWEDAGESLLYGLRAPEMPGPYEVFFICTSSPQDKYRVDKARKLLGWEAKDRFEELYRRS